MAVVINVYGKTDLAAIDKARAKLDQLERDASKASGGFKGSMLKMQDSATSMASKAAAGFAALGIASWLKDSVKAAEGSQVRQIALVKAVDNAGSAFGRQKVAQDNAAKAADGVEAAQQRLAVAQQKVTELESKAEAVRKKHGVASKEYAKASDAVTTAQINVEKASLAAVKAQAGQEKAQAMIKTSTEGLGKTYKDYAGQIDATVKSISGMSAQTRSDTKDALTGLITQTGDVSGSMKNMALVADLAEAKHMSMADAASLVGKVMNGNTTILKRTIGINADGMTSTQALGLVYDSVKGRAEAYGNSEEGRQKKLENSFKSIQVQVGTILLPAVEKATEVLQKFADWFDGLPKAQQNFGLLVAAIAAGGFVLAPFLNTIKTATELVGGLGKGIVGLAKNIPGLSSLKLPNIGAKAAEIGSSIKTGIGDAIASLSERAAAARTAVSARFEEIGTKASETGTRIRTKIGDALDSLSTKASDAKTKVNKRLEEMGASIAAGGGGITGLVNAAGTGALGLTGIFATVAAGTGLALLQAKIADALEPLQKANATKLLEALGMGEDKAKEFADVFGAQMKLSQGPTGAFGAFLGATITDGIRAFDRLTGRSQEAQTYFGKTTPEWQATFGRWGQIVKDFGSGASGALGGVGGAAKGVAGAVSTAAGKVSDAFKPLPGKIASAISGAWSSVTSTVSTKIKDVVKQVSGMAASFKTAGQNAVKGLWQGIQGLGPWLHSQIVAWAKATLPAAVVKALNIQSPSRVMADLGEKAVDGLLLPFLASRDRAAAAARNVADALTAGATMSMRAPAPAFAGGGGSSAFSGGITLAPGAVVINVPPGTPVQQQAALASTGSQLLLDALKELKRS